MPHHTLPGPWKGTLRPKCHFPRGMVMVRGQEGMAGTALGTVLTQDDTMWLLCRQLLMALEVSKKARDKQVNFRDEGNSIIQRNTPRDKQVTTSLWVRCEEKSNVGTYTSEMKETLKCKGENRDPFILSRVVCAHMVCALQYCNYMYLLVVILKQLFVGNQIEHLIDRSADTTTAIVGILTIENKRISIRRTKTIKISKDSLFS